MSPKLEYAPYGKVSKITDSLGQSPAYTYCVLGCLLTDSGDIAAGDIIDIFGVFNFPKITDANGRVNQTGIENVVSGLIAPHA